MKNKLIFIIALILTAGILSACEYERMTYQPSYRQYEKKMPPVVPGAVPVDGGEINLKEADLDTLVNPIQATSASIERGKLNYTYYCIQCHGSRYNGEGTVGQSFNPIPTDLMSVDVQDMTEAEIFYIISYGGDRSPPLWYTISVNDRWHLVNWIKSLGLRSTTEKPNPSGDFKKPLN